MNAALPRLETERLVLSVPERGDYLLLRDLVADPQVHRFLGPRPDDPTTDMFARALRAAGSWQLYGYGMFLAHERVSGAFVGQLGVFHSLRGIGKGLDDVPEAGWILAQVHWGKGYALEAMRAVLEWFDVVQAELGRAESGQEEGRIACMIERGNDASFALAAKLGFVRYDQEIMPDGAIVDLLERISAGA
ncbi:MAG: hypothetical protein RIS85_445 [Pseudomonadota bacterium]